MTRTANPIPTSAAVLLAVLLLAGGAATAADAPLACQAGGLPGCSFESDVIVFAQGDPTYEIVGRIHECLSCTPIGTGPDFTFDGEIEVDFGPYDPAAGCQVSETVRLAITGDLRRGNPTPSGEATYIPRNPTDSFYKILTQDLQTNCVDAGNLDYRIREFELTGANGATSFAAFLQPPEPVRIEEGGTYVQQHPLPSFRFPQDLGFSFVEDEPASSTLRFYPDGLPFKLGPDLITYRPEQVVFSTPGGASAPTPYEPIPLPSAADAGLNPGQVRECLSQPEPANTCSTPHIRNAGYLDDPAWAPSSGQFDVDGLTVTLDLSPGDEVIYQTLFPQESWVKLLGPATVNVQDGRIVSGSFQGGTAWVQLDRDDCRESLRLQYNFVQGAQQPVLQPDGSLMAGIANLHQLDPVTLQPQEVTWNNNEASGLGCGTFWTPPALVPQNRPQEGWLSSAVPTIHGRGIYAGLNYNRNRVCEENMVLTDQFCATDADCNPGGRCIDGGFSPLCPSLPPTPVAQWHTRIQDVQLQFAVDPDQAGQGDREMVFFGRKSGITGVFDAGDNPFPLGNSGGMPPTFEFQFDRFGLAYLGSESERADTIVQGRLIVPWPADEGIPFEEMQVCNCGAIDQARTPDVLLQKTLKYWDQEFSPYGLNFKAQPAVSCADVPTDTCQNNTQATEVCVEALTPVPHFEPDPVSVFDLTPDGQVPTGIQPFSVAELDFSEDKEGPVLQDPYEYHIEKFVLQDWVAAGSPSQQAVTVDGTEDYGYADAVGEIFLPFFGMVNAGIKVERQRQPLPAERVVDMHRECDPVVNPGCNPEDPNLSYIETERKMAGDSVILHYKADYFLPEDTEDPDDGTNGAFRGRGPIMAFSYDPNNPGTADEKATVNFGSISAPTGMILQPDPGQVYPGVMVGGDLGPAAAMRLYDAMTGLGSSKLDTILPPGYIDSAAVVAYEQVLDALGYGGMWFETVTPQDVKNALQAADAMDLFASHPGSVAFYNVNPNNVSPPMNATGLLGFMDFSGDLEVLDLITIGADLNTGGQFFQMESALQTIDRHVQQGEEPISQLTREILPAASNRMQLPGEQDIAFPPIPGVAWHFDYTVTTSPTPSFEFKSLTGTLDLTKGGLSGLGFDELGATLKFYDDGDWYFDASLKLDWNGYGVNGLILLGNTKDLQVVRERDPMFASFIKGIPAFQGVYARAGMSMKFLDYGCALSVGAGVQVGGWFLTDSFGGKVRGWITGRGACLVSVRGDLTLLGGVVNDRFKLKGHMWVAGGFGFCDEDGWDSPSDVLDDDWCAACVVSGTCTGVYPDGDIDFSGPKVKCSL